MSQAYICQEYRGMELEEESVVNGLVSLKGSQESEDDFGGNVEMTKKRQRIGEIMGEKKPSTFSNFTDEDLSYYVTRVPIETQEKMRNMLRSENGQLSGIIYKMIESRLNAVNAKINKLMKELRSKDDEIMTLVCNMDKQIEKIEGMSKFTYAWCKSAQEAGIFKMKQRY